MEDYSLSDTKAPNPNALPEGLANQIQELNEIQLIALRHELDIKLSIGVDKLNLTDELSLQYRQGKMLLQSLEGDQLTPVNQKAQVFNTLQSQIEKIVKMRAAIYNQERLKRYEAAFLKVLEQLGSDEQKETFMELYGEFLKDRGN